jgi:hypothetical protein
VLRQIGGKAEFAVDAGSEMRRTLGVAVFAGMSGVTLFGIFFDAGVLRRAMD